MDILIWLSCIILALTAWAQDKEIITTIWFATAILISVIKGLK